MVEANPELLDSPALSSIERSEREGLLHFVSEPDLAARLLSRLVDVDDEVAVRLLTNRFPDVVADGVLDATTEWIRGERSAVPECWPHALRSLDPGSLLRRLLGRVASTSGLAALASIIGLDIQIGLRAAPTTWAKTLVGVRDEVEGEARQRLLAFLLAMALRQPVRGCEPLFERSFEAVHSDLWSARLPRDALRILSDVLPDLYWWEQWDYCLRLRVGAVNAYVNFNLDPKSFRSLSSDPGLYNRLTDLAEASKEGRRFMKRSVL